MNHSLRTRAATELHQADVPENHIQEQTGHWSLKALQVYEHTTTHQQQAVSCLLSSTKSHMVCLFSSTLQLPKQSEQPLSGEDIDCICSDALDTLP